MKWSKIGVTEETKWTYSVRIKGFLGVSSLEKKDIQGWVQWISLSWKYLWYIFYKEIMQRGIRKVEKSFTVTCIMVNFLCKKETNNRKKGEI